jgi:hypothetical protein
MKAIKILGIIISLGMFASGCSTSRTGSDKVKGANLSAYKTYAWLTTEMDTSGNQSLRQNEITVDRIKKAADEEMKSRGYIPDASDPDLLLLLHTSFENQSTIVSRPYYSSHNYYYPGYSGATNFPFYYTGYNAPYINNFDVKAFTTTDETLILDAVDRDKNQVVWRGWLENTVYNEKDIDKIYKKVDTLFKKYPVKKKKK